MPKLRRVSGEEAVRAPQRLGFVRVRYLQHAGMTGITFQ